MPAHQSSPRERCQPISHCPRKYWWISTTCETSPESTAAASLHRVLPAICGCDKQHRTNAKLPESALRSSRGCCSARTRFRKSCSASPHWVADLSARERVSSAPQESQHPTQPALL